MTGDTSSSSSVTSYTRLEDFDWSLRLVLSSDKLSDLKKPLLMLSLDTIDANEAKKNHLLEMTSEELKAFIGKLKTVQKVGK